MIGLLLDEHISPALVSWLADLGIYAQSVPHVGLGGRGDREIGNMRWITISRL
jgi:predicted nuclease of predicted toxin-antitoxin system